MKTIKTYSFNLLGLIFLFICFKTYAKEVSGKLTYHANQEIKLFGYDGFKTVELANSSIDTIGNFCLNYKDYKGMGYLETSDKSQLTIVLNESFIKINGTHLKYPDSMKFVNSCENSIFVQYAVEHNQRLQALSGWNYLLPQYKEVELLKLQSKYVNLIQKEITRLEKQDINYLSNIPSNYYVSWFIPLRKMLDDIPISAQQHPQKISCHIKDFRNIDFKNNKLYHSGILNNLIESHYWLIENGGMSLDSMYSEMNISTDILIEKLEGNDKRLNEFSDFLFKLLEKRSLFVASEYLALKLLTNYNYSLNSDLSKRLETYRVMKIGNTAPEIVFEGKKMIMGSEIKKVLTLSDLNSTYTLVVFGSSWCISCTEEISKIKNKYIHWKIKGVETVFISLDSNENEFKNFVEDFPFLSFSDFKNWKSKSVQDYYVFTTPTLFLLDKDRKIILRPRSIEQVDTWINYKTVSKN